VLSCAGERIHFVKRNRSRENSGYHSDPWAGL
jgi:hypothetical protein